MEASGRLSFLLSSTDATFKFVAGFIGQKPLDGGEYLASLGMTAAHILASSQKLRG